MASWYDPDLWMGLATWTTVALTPLFVMLPCVLQPDLDVTRVSRKQWFYSTRAGPHKILAEWHTLWLLLVCLVGGVAQFLAWRDAREKWYYPAAMLAFYLSIGFQWAFIAAYFRLVNRFRTARVQLFLLLCANALLVGLYAPLNKVSALLIAARMVAHDAPMLFIAHLAVKIHAEVDETTERPDSPEPQRRSRQHDDESPPEPSRDSRDKPRRRSPARNPHRKPLSADEVQSFLRPESLEK
jgi:hypothetical protein